MLGLGLYILLSGLFGYMIATTILSIMILRAMDTKSWRVVILSSIGVAVASYILFKILLGLPLPSGSIISLG